MSSQNSKKHQKELKRKLLKKENKKTELAYINCSTIQAVQFPIRECLVPDNLSEEGIGNLVISRTLPNGHLASVTFLLDTFCLGIKNVSYAVLSPHEYDSNFQKLQMNSPYSMVSPSLFKSVIVKGVEYANNLGFTPYEDYDYAMQIMSDVECCDTNLFKFGKDGKPFYFRGPNESWEKAYKICQHLENTLGKDNFHYMIGVSDSEFLFDLEKEIED
jgi:hypothetical protein